jgi:hypothetical protein
MKIVFNRITRYGKTYLHPNNDAAETVMKLYPPVKKCFDEDKIELLLELGHKVQINNVDLKGITIEDKG